ncbi:MAG: MMPL family transporter, partial [Planctomycetes bacterium]|nr:MMPL family transporter [Planctomycetota bacterium]
MRAIPWLMWGVAAALSGVGLRHYRIDNDFGNWIPELVAVGAVQSYAVVGFERESFDEAEIVAALRALPSVRYCLGLAEVELLERFGGVTPEHLVISDDGTYAGIFVFRRSDGDDDSLVRQIRTALAKYDSDLARFALAGPAVFHVQLNDFSQRRLPVIMLLINLMGGLWMWWITGKPRVAAAAVAAIVVSQIVLLGIVSWQRIPVDMSLSMVPPLIMALGYSYAAHRALRHGITGTLLLCGG